ncbi:hypothetical protein ACTFIU_002507 [Dictyostelium citrinum]
MDSNLINWLNNCSAAESIIDSVLIISRNGIFLSKENLIDFCKSKCYKKIGLGEDQFRLLKNEILISLENHFRNENEIIIYKYEPVKEINLKLETSIRELIENNIKLNQMRFIKNIDNNENNNNNINNNYNNNEKLNKNEDEVIIDLNKYIENNNNKDNYNDINNNDNNNIEKSNKEILVIELIPRKWDAYFYYEIPLIIAGCMTAKEYSNFIKTINRAYSGYWILFLIYSSYAFSILALIFTFPYYKAFPIWLIFLGAMILFSIFHIIYRLFLRYRHLHRITGSFNRKLIENSVPLEFHIVYKKKKFPQTKNTMTMIIHYFYNSKNTNVTNNIYNEESQMKINEIDV